MALLINARDLRPLYDTPSSMDALLESITTVFRNLSTGEGVNHPDLRLTLEDHKRTLRFLSATSPGCGVGMRAFPLFRGTRDANFILLFDGATGEFQALVAGGVEGGRAQR